MRILLAHKTFDLTPYIVTDFVLPVGAAFSSICSQILRFFSPSQPEVSKSHANRGGWIQPAICRAWTSSESWCYSSILAFTAVAMAIHILILVLQVPYFDLVAPKPGYFLQCFTIHGGAGTGVAYQQTRWNSYIGHGCTILFCQLICNLSKFMQFVYNTNNQNNIKMRKILIDNTKISYRIHCKERLKILEEYKGNK